MLYGHRGNAELLRGRLAEASEYWRRTLDVAQQWVARNPSDAARNALGLAHRRVSVGLQLTGDLAKSLEHARAAVAIHEPLAAAEPASTARQREILNSYEQLSYVAGNPEHLNLGDRDMATAYNRKVVAIAEALRDADPNNTMAGSDLVVAKRLTCAIAPDSDASLVARVCQDALDSAARNGREPIEALPLVALRLGPALASLGRRAEAEATMKSALDVLENAAARWPWRTGVRLQLLRVHNAYGSMLARLADRAPALVQFRNAVAIGEALLPERPQDPVIRRDLADAYANLGKYWEPRDVSQARSWYQKELALWSDWPRRIVTGRLDQSRRELAARNLSRLAGR
jgi:tetratricopeptide (TPR) repeat protein